MGGGEPSFLLATPQSRVQATKNSYGGGNDGDCWFWTSPASHEEHDYGCHHDSEDQRRCLCFDPADEDSLCVCDHGGGADGDGYCCDKANAGMMMLMVVVVMTTKKTRSMRVGALVMMMMMMLMMMMTMMVMAEMAMVMKMPCLRYASSF